MLAHTQDKGLCRQRNVHPQDKNLCRQRNALVSDQLTHAVRIGNVERVKHLLMNERAQPTMGVPLLFLAARSGSFEILQMLLENSANPLNAKDFLTGNTALHAAAQSGDTKMLFVLLNRGAAASSTNNINNTPLHIAAIFGHYQALWILLANSADKSLKNKHDHTALDIAREIGNPDIIRSLEAPLKF